MPSDGTICNTCGGSGFSEPEDPDSDPCDNCEGTGWEPKE